MCSLVWGPQRPLLQKWPFSVLVFSFFLIFVYFFVNFSMILFCFFLLLYKLFSFLFHFFRFIFYLLFICVLYFLVLGFMFCPNAPRLQSVYPSPTRRVED